MLDNVTIVANDTGGGPEDNLEWHRFATLATSGTWHEVAFHQEPPERIHGWSYALIMESTQPSLPKKRYASSLSNARSPG